MHNPAPTQHPVHDLIKHRWSPRAFSGQPIPPEILRSLFEAARWAPSSSNEQPWAFLVATSHDKENHARMLSTLVEFNQGWAKHAPVLAIAVSEMAFAKTGKPNRNAFYDTGSAVAHLSMEATSRGLFVHQMAGFDPHKAIELFEIPTGWEPISAFTVGYPGDPETLPDTLRQRELAPRERKTLDSFVMSGHWGNPASFLQK
ncbi:MAG TPA: nitroreductase family protein [Candidatus Limnocylindrales bacterium]|nr:nitroreductase family protein [Candidatus Limnocylindrales bacterium]